MRYAVTILLLAFARPALALPPLFGTTAEERPTAAAKLSARIDEHLAAKWQGKVQPAPAASGAEFFRRLSLDLTGRVPSLSLAKDFLDDDRPDKRRLWGDEFLDGAEFADRYAAHFATRWRAILLAQANPQVGTGGARLEDWLRRQFRANAPYDKLARGLLTDAGATEYFNAYEGKAENVAGATARSLLGVRLECAQCHDDRGGGGWTRDQFWEYAAFFTRLPVARVEGNMVRAGTDTGDGPPRIKVPDKDAFATAKFLDGSPLDWKAGANAQAVFAEWATRPDNRWFARAAVNRVWHHFFGVGLIEPVDGLGSTDNPPSHPELLDELTREFVAHKFDVKFLMRAVVGTKAYQRTSRQTHASQADPRAFGRMPVRAMSAEQLFDSVVEATGYVPPAENAGDYVIGPATSPRAKFLAKFQTHPDQPLDTHASIQQALFLMNGKLATTATGTAGSRTLATIMDGPGGTADKIGELFLVVLSRKPTAAETKRLGEFVAAADDKKAALADVFWVLLNSTEFAVNH